ncbi:MAG: hypothetical protein M3O71_25725 [Bacteroidota bacterium]|nr:hypothetical protein [Bacteroidota bacterium]
MINYLEHKVSKNELITIFKRNLDRSIFIGEYPYFGSDGNEVFYEAFIESNILKHKFKVQEDAIELSVRLNIYKVLFLREIKKIVYSRRQGIINLVCLDWLFYFFQDIPKDEFIEINEHVSKHSTSDLLKVQSVLNILLFKPDIQLIKNLISYFTESDDPSVFYRLINSLDTNQLAKRFTNETINSIKEIVLSKHAISKDQRNEIIKKLSALGL